MAVFNAGNRPHRQHFYGNSTDTKPTNTYIGDLFYELDTGIEYIFDGANWIVYELPKRQYFYGNTGDEPTDARLGDLFYAFDDDKTSIYNGVSWQEYKQPALYVEPAP